jgi:hypothetical protein
MRDPYRRFAKKTYREIIWALRHEEMPEGIIDLTVEAIKEQRRAISTAKRQRNAHRQAWDELIAPLQHERRIVRSMVKYRTSTQAPEREAFVQDYYDLLNKAYAKLASMRDARDTLPAHSHWTDYVPERIKDAFIVEASLIPIRVKAKFKEPFTRTVPAVIHNRRRGRLLRHINSELDSAVSSDDTDKANKLKAALKALSALPTNAHIPNHWAELLVTSVKHAQRDISLG